jgi:hypothetical protein
MMLLLLQLLLMPLLLLLLQLLLLQLSLVQLLVAAQCQCVQRSACTAVRVAVPICYEQ